MKQIFIDTNIFTAYLLLSEIKKSRRIKKSLWKKYKKLEPSYKLILKISKIKSKKKKYGFMTSYLAIAEILNSLFDEAICKRMSEDGLPLSSWFKKKEHYMKFNLEDWEEEQLNEGIIKLSQLNNMNLVNEEYDFMIISRLIFSFKLKTQDSILFSTALKKECSYFITRDERDLLKNKELHKYHNKIKIISPEEALNLIK